MKKLNLLDMLIFLFVVLFLYAAVSKLLDYELFEAQIGKSPLIISYASWMAWLIPTLEIVIAFLLLIPRTQVIGLFAFFSLMLMFTLYILFILNFSPYVPCSCGGILSNMGWTEHLIFNIAFTILPVFALILHTRINARVSVAEASA